MINCNQPQCKKHKTCNLKQPTNPLTTEIRYWLKELQKAKNRLNKYALVLNDIQDHKYSTPVNVYGHIEYAPKQNIFGVFIQRPEHVHYGWNWNKLQKEIDDLIEKIRVLRLQELEMIRDGN